MNSPSDVLKQKRLRAGLTQAQLAERMGVPKTTYAEYERGRRPVPDGFVKQVERELGTKWIEPNYHAVKRGNHGMPTGCKGCKWRSTTGSYSICDFFGQTGELRGCPVENCTRYEKGPRKDKHKEWSSGKYTC